MFFVVNHTAHSRRHSPGRRHSCPTAALRESSFQFLLQVAIIFLLCVSIPRRHARARFSKPFFFISFLPLLLTAAVVVVVEVVVVIFHTLYIYACINISLVLRPAKLKGDARPIARSRLFKPRDPTPHPRRFNTAQTGEGWEDKK